jgi:hypothetical protein
MPITRRDVSSLFLAVAGVLAAAPFAWGQVNFPTPQGNQNATGVVEMCPTASNVYVPCDAPGAMPRRVLIVPGVIPVTVNPLVYPYGSTPLTGNAAGTTGAVVGTLAARPTATTYICGFNVSAIGGTAAVGPITVANTLGSSMVYQLASTASGAFLTAQFTPCIPANATNTAITITTTADGTATAVNVNSWGFQL